MPTGVSHLMRPEDQPTPGHELEPDNSYYLIRLTDAQAFFPAGLLSQAQSLLFTSSVESSLLPGHSTQSLHNYTTIKKNKPFRLGVHADLTDWLPARKSDRINITLKYSVTRGSPIKAFVDKIDDLDLATELSIFGPGMAVGIKVTEIVGKLLSSLLQENQMADVFPPMPIDLDLADMRAGYYVMVGSLTDEIWPRLLAIKENGPLTERSGRALARHSYVVIQVLVLKRRGLKIFQETSWGELLQICRDRAIYATWDNESERRRILQEWKANLGLVRALVSKDHSVLPGEVDEMIGEAHLAVDQHVQPDITHEGFSSVNYPDDWQNVLGFANPQALHSAVNEYHEALTVSEQLLETYSQKGFRQE